MQILNRKIKKLLTLRNKVDKICKEKYNKCVEKEKTLSNI